MTTPKYFDWSQTIDVPLRIVKFCIRSIWEEQGAWKQSSMFNSNSIGLKFSWFKDRRTARISRVNFKSSWILALKFVKSENFANFCSYIFWFLKMKVRDFSRIYKAYMIVSPHRVFLEWNFLKSLRIEQKHIVTVTAWSSQLMLIGTFVNPLTCYYLVYHKGIFSMYYRQCYRLFTVPAVPALFSIEHHWPCC